MEAKTIGKFIAVLRKAKGMTQKDLGDLLNVSDKTVSRWERDETMPDISLFPILAQILGVTTDELLHGERNAAELPKEHPQKKAERIAWVLDKCFAKYQSLSLVSVCLALVGMIAAVILNFSFHKATLGFYCFLIGFLPGCFCQLGLYKYYSSGNQIQDISSEKLSYHKEKMLHTTLKFSYILFVIFAVCIPLLVFGKVKYTDYFLGMGFDISEVNNMTTATMPKIEVGLQAKSWLFYGGLFGAAAAFLSLIFDSIFKFIKKKNNRQLKYTVITFIIVCITLTVSFFIHKELPPYLAEGCEFHDYPSFINYMETIPDDMAWGVVELRKDNDYWRRQVYDTDGNVLFEYTFYNEDVVDIKYAQNDLRLPVTTYTKEQLDAGIEKADRLLWIPALAVVMECVGAIMIYKRRRKN